MSFEGLRLVRPHDLSVKADLAVESFGGTFEKRYNPKDGTHIFDNTRAPEYLAAMGYEGTARINARFMMDSLQMGDVHFRMVAEIFQSLPEEAAVAIFGTDKMVRAARACARAGVGEKMRLVFTGALIPAGYEKTDGPRNFAGAVEEAEQEGYGIFIHTAGRTLPHDDAVKDTLYDPPRFVTVDEYRRHKQDVAAAKRRAAARIRSVRHNFIARHAEGLPPTAASA